MLQSQNYPDSAIESHCIGFKQLLKVCKMPLSIVFETDFYVDDPPPPLFTPL
eukprot:c15568_g1_i1 orf=109-264(+)